MKVYDVKPLEAPIEIELDLPASKSEANRALVAAALTPGQGRLRGLGTADDIRYMQDGLRRLGFDVRGDVAEGELELRGGCPESSTSAGGEIFCGNAGTALRFLVSVAALVPGDWTIDGDSHMRVRPIGDLVAAWRSLGLDIEDSDGCPPLRLRGGEARGGRVRLDASRSSQYLSSLLLVGSRLPEGIEIELVGELASPGYVDLTIEVLRSFGVEVRRAEASFFVAPQNGVWDGDFEVEGDWSAAGAWSILEAMGAARFRPKNLRADSLQADRCLGDAIDRLCGPDPRVLDLRGIPDQMMNLGVLAAARVGETRIVGAANLRHKECDRLAVYVGALRALGVESSVEPDGIRIVGTGQLKPAKLDPAGDHRMAMAFALFGLLSPGVRIEDPDCVSKSYPGFFSDLESCRSQRRPLALIGMRGAGKTELGRSFARAAGLDFIDSDEVFVEREGPIDAFVAARGWPAFRAIEETIVEEALVPGVLCALGGGAVESERSRSLLSEAAIVVWLREELSTLSERLERKPRPALLGGDPLEELADVLGQREPLYRQLATFELAAGSQHRGEGRGSATGASSALCLARASNSLLTAD